MSTIPPIEQPFVDGVFKALSQMEVELDTDPLQHGPKRLTGKIAEARGLLTHCERIYMQIAQLLQQYRAANRASQLEFDLGLQHLLANDPEVRAGRNVRDRDAIATMKMHDEKQTLSVLSAAVMDLEAVMAATKAKRTDLKDVQGRLRDQMKLCNEEIGLGARWGSKPAPGQKTPDLDAAPRVDVTTIDELHDLFQGGKPVELQAPQPVEKEVEALGVESLLDDVLNPSELTEEEKTQKNVDHWAKTLNEQGPINGKEIKEALPATDAEPEEVDDFLAAIDPAMPQPKLSEEVSIDDILGDL